MAITPRVVCAVAGVILGILILLNSRGDKALIFTGVGMIVVSIGLVAS